MNSQNHQANWAKEKRYEFIEFRLFWHGTMNRSDLEDNFGISTQQASLDINTYIKLAPENLTYDKSKRTYVRGDNFKAQVQDISASTYLGQILAMHEDIVRLDQVWLQRLTERFRKFLRVSFGEDHFQENLKFIEDALGKDLRKYFTKDFYADHVKRYKKRPIYWMFSSPKGSFNALIYLHRYRGDTVSVVLNEYLRDYITKLESHRAEQQKITDNSGFAQGDRTRAQKEVDRVGKIIHELRDWERDVILPLAHQRIEIDLDDGVKANYPLFGTALKKIAGLS